MKFQCVQDRADIIDESLLNEFIKVSFNIKGNKWEKDGKVSYFSNLDAWRIEKVSSESSRQDEIPPPSIPDDPDTENEDLDDLPF